MPDLPDSPDVAPNAPGGANQGLRCHALALALAISGGLLGIIGAAVQEFRGGDPLIAFVGAPIIEEALKPAGVYILLIRWPKLLRSRLYTAGLTAISGLCFGVVESLVYVAVYVPEHTESYVLFRFTVTPALHAVASFIVGFGITPRLLASMKGEIPLLQGSRKFFIAGMALHSAYNITAFALSLAGVLDFESK